MSGLLSTEQKADGVLHVSGGRRLRVPLGRLVILHHGLGDLSGPHVAGNFHDHRARAPVAKVVKGAPHDTGNHVRLPDHFTVFGHRLVSPDRGKIGPDVMLVHRRAARQVENGYVISKGLRQAAHGVL